MRNLPLAAVALAGLLAAAPALAANFWFDFNHDNNLSTIQPYTSQSQDTASVVIDLSGLTLPAPFTVIWQSSQYLRCFPNQGTGSVAGIQILDGSLIASADSSWITDSSTGDIYATNDLGVRFTQNPGSSPVVALKLVFTYPSPETTPCPGTAGNVDFTAASASGQPLGAPHTIKIKDSNVPVAPPTWGQLRRMYR